MHLHVNLHVRHHITAGPLVQIFYITQLYRDVTSDLVEKILDSRLGEIFPTWQLVLFIKGMQHDLERRPRHCIYHFFGKVASYHVCQLLPSFTVSFTFSVFRKSHSYRLLTLASFFTDPARAGKVAYSAGWCTHKWL